MLGTENHKFFDPQVFFLDEELRKQIELLKGAVVFTAQERPEGIGRGVREDLFKNWVSADGIFGRLPYQIATKVISLVGWKRMELNRLIKFQGIDESNFHSIFRRCRLIRSKARFVEAAALKDIPDPANAGFFLRQPDLKEFLQSGPAVAAGLRIQHSFETAHSRNDCELLISSFIYGGGGNGDTEKYLREACGLPPLPPKTKSTTTTGDAQPVRPLGIDLGISPPVDAPMPVADDNDLDAAFLRGLFRRTVVYMREKELEHMTEVYFRSVGTCKEQRKNGNKVLWDRLIQTDTWLTAVVSTKTKSKGAFFPTIRTEARFEVILAPASALACPTISRSFPRRTTLLLWNTTRCCPIAGRMPCC